MREREIKGIKNRESEREFERKRVSLPPADLFPAFLRSATDDSIDFKYPPSNGIRQSLSPALSPLSLRVSQESSCVLECKVCVAEVEGMGGRDRVGVRERREKERMSVCKILSISPFLSLSLFPHQNAPVN